MHDEGIQNALKVFWRVVGLDAGFPGRRDEPRFATAQDGINRITVPRLIR